MSWRVLAWAVVLAGCAQDTADVPPVEPARTPAVGPAMVRDEPAAASPVAPLGPSLFPLGLTFEDQDGRTVALADLAGKPLVLGMFYASCPTACPLLIRNLQLLEQKLDPATRAELRVVLVSFDPEVDTPARLTELAGQYGLDGKRWRLGRADGEAVRDLAAALGIRYRKLANGHFNHSSTLTLLDAQGRPVATQEGLLPEVEPIASVLRGLVAR